MRTKARIDRNQPQIVNGLRRVGASVIHVHQLKNCFDILVGYRGRNYAFEIKDPDQVPSKRKLTKGEQEFFDTWRGQVHKIETLDEAIAIITKS